DKDIGEVMIRFTDRRGRGLCLGPTHEEVITDLVKNNLSSYKQLPLVLYQIQTKFRDEIRPRFGLIRACEFIMKDAYSFDRDEKGLDKNYEAMLSAYKRIFKRCGLDFLTPEADPGVMGGSFSHEFMAPAKDAEDLALVCPKCKLTKAFKQGLEENCPKCAIKLEKLNCIEVGHIFKLGTKYSQSLGANFLDSDGKLKPVIMGCYGIGVSRLIPSIIEQNYDQDGIIWPDEVTPYKVIILPLDVTDKEISKMSGELYQELEAGGIEPLLDDRDERAGVKFKDADLIGLPLQIIIGKEFLNNRKIELKIRRGNKKIIKSRDEILQEVNKWTPPFLQGGLI
ncbi:MAG TPA: aminoacyl--tRNA ligase-related protein, partial [Candidatus Omnitrophota bacterium]|nr:aminoacyl--tRNA ligase-related protein [Candidatus Omnitrophota bacterium]